MANKNLNIILKPVNNAIAYLIFIYLFNVNRIARFISDLNRKFNRNYCL